MDSNELASSLLRGSSALFPTDTLPAIAACPEFASQLWTLKKRPANKPFILMAASSKELLEFVLPCAYKDALAMSKKYWPGALTLILPANGKIVEALNPGGESLGMRIPDLPLTRDLLKRSGPLATSSANLSGGSSSLTAEEASSYFPEVPLLKPLPWPKCSQKASTLISWKGSGLWHILRRGAVIPENLI